MPPKRKRYTAAGKRVFPTSFNANRVKVKLGVDKLNHSDLYRKKQLGQEINLWALEPHSNGEPRLAVLQSISDFIMQVPTRHRIQIESAGDNYRLLMFWFINEHRQKVYFFVRMLRSARAHTLERSITYVGDRAMFVLKHNKITWTHKIDLRSTPAPQDIRQLIP
jgi:hypothetical protein